MNPFIVVAIIAPIVATGAFFFSRRRATDFVFYLGLAILAGCFYVMLPWFRGGDFRYIGSIHGIIRLGIVVGGIVFFGMLFRSQRL